MTTLVMRKHQRPRRKNASDIDADISKGRTILIEGASWNNVSNIIARFRRRKITVHSQRIGSGSFMIWPD